MPAAATVQVVEPLASFMTPKSVPAYRSPVRSSRTRSVTGRSARLYDLSTHVAVEPVRVTSNTWPGVVGVLVLYREYEIHGRLGFSGSTEIDDTNRLGSFVAEVSSRVNATDAAGASALSEMN